jgi:hypothetical protein
MDFFGLTDPYIVTAYIACFVCVILCCAYGIFYKEKGRGDK